jgi:outer membrane usher protein
VAWLIALSLSPLVANGANDRSLTAAPATAPPTAGDAEIVYLAVRINGQQLDKPSRLLRTQNGQLYALAEDFRRWRLQLPSHSLEYLGNVYYPIAAPDLKYHVDESTQELIIEASPRAFPTTHVGARQVSTPLTASPAPGAFLNYDLYARTGHDIDQTNGLLELGVFGRSGVGTNTVLEQITNGHFSQTRLETTWTVNQPRQMASWRLGDTINRPGLWGGAIRFGGVQWSTNFGLQPNFISFPLPGLRGQASLPSTIDLYINNTLAMSREVPPGPFNVSSLPVTVGQGQIRLVQRDILGRQQVISAPYYASAALLRQGLQDFSYELGFIRKDFGIASAHYGPPFGAATLRRGFTNQLTGEAHVELQHDQQSLGFGTSYLQPTIGVITTALAGSQSQSGWGSLGILQLDRQLPRLSYGARLQMASRQFTRLGMIPGQSMAQRQAAAYLGVSPGYGSLSVSYTNQDRWEGGESNILSVNYGFPVSRDYVLNLSLVDVTGAGSNRLLGVTLTHVIDQRTALFADIVNRQETTSSTLQIQRNLPLGDGLGYHALVGTGNQNHIELGAALKNAVGVYSIDAARFHNHNSFQLSASGGLGLFAGEAFWARRFNGSFAVVDVDGYPNVGIYQNNQLVAHTDASGRALISGLLPYQDNVIRIDPADMPMDAHINSLTVNARPSYRSGVLLDFPVKSAKGALISIVLEGGSFLPAGAVVRFAGTRESFPVGYHGQVYITGLAAQDQRPAGNHLQATWHGKTCDLEITMPETRDPLPHLGPFVCKGVTL